MKLLESLDQILDLTARLPVYMILMNRILRWQWIGLFLPSSSLLSSLAGCRATKFWRSPLSYSQKNILISKITWTCFLQGYQISRRSHVAAIFNAVFFPKNSGRVNSFCSNVSVGIRNRKAHSPTDVAGISFPRTRCATIDLVIVKYSSSYWTRWLMRTYMDTIGSNNDIFSDCRAICQSQSTSLAIHINHWSRQI